MFVDPVDHMVEMFNDIWLPAPDPLVIVFMTHEYFLTWLLVPLIVTCSLFPAVSQSE